MARIRTIKPEFPQSESMGRVSRDARLLFVQLWTICDDEGRSRGNSRMLASLLFPYDDDAPGLIDGWLDELEQVGCVVRYSIDGSSYIQVLNWLIHQKIDKPSKSKIPGFDESSRILSNPLEESCVDQGSRIKDQGSKPPADAGGGADKPAPPGRPDCPHQEIIGLYHEMLPACREVAVWSDHRQKLLRTRWNEDPKRQSLDWWRRFFAYIAKSKFLTGRGACAPGRDPFVADLEWLIRPTNFVKVIEGKYHSEDDV